MVDVTASIAAAASTALPPRWKVIAPALAPIIGGWILGWERWPAIT
jgi:hypothetical protein